MTEPVPTSNRVLDGEIDNSEREEFTDVDDQIYFATPHDDEQGERLDRFLAKRFPDLSRAYVQRLITSGKVTVEGVERKRTHKVAPGEFIEVRLEPSTKHHLEPEPIPLAILYEDADMLVLDKPAGLVVHPAPGHSSGTLVHALLYLLPDLTIGGEHRPGIVHRLDKDTSGVMVVAKSDRGHASLLKQWSDRKVRKTYLALVKGIVQPDEGTIDVPIRRDPRDRLRMAAMAGGREAVTHFNVLDRFRDSTFVEIDLITGRTHQIRTHFAFIGHPVVGDPLYNRSSGPTGGTMAVVDRQFLHASQIALELPDGTPMVFEAPLPDDLRVALDRVAKEQPAL
jgi:23S rRNA pseudouridine1911/1915/1917 synthase